MVIKSAGLCESCGKDLEPFLAAKNLEDNFINDSRESMHICIECFKKRFKIVTKKSSGYGGTIYELEERQQPRFGSSSQSYSCLKCNWVAWGEAGLRAHMHRAHR